MKKTITQQRTATAVLTQEGLNAQFFLKLFYTLFLLFCLNAVFSQQNISSVKSGNWSDPAVWNTNTIPTANDTVQVADSVVIDLSSSSCADLLVHSNGVLTADSMGLLEIKGNWSNSGTFNANYGMVKFSGASLQTIGGSASTTFYDLMIQNTSNVNLGSSAEIKSVLYLELGTLFTQGNSFTFLSNSLETASIAQIKTGADIIGNITFQQYVNTPGWRFLSSPVSGTTLQDWSDDFTTAGFPGSSSPNDSLSSIYTYYETVQGRFDSGYVKPNQVTDLVITGKGYACSVGASTVVSVSGPVTKSAHSFPVSLTASSFGLSNDGWNLVANPYPSAIDWEASSWTKSGIENSVYWWNTEKQQFSSYVNGIGINGGSNVIPAAAGFFVKAHQNTPALACNESVKVQKNQVRYRKKLFVLSLSRIRSRTKLSFVFLLMDLILTMVRKMRLNYSLIVFTPLPSLQ
jgi:hypothetical protein